MSTTATSTGSFPPALSDTVREAFEAACPSIFKAKATYLGDSTEPPSTAGIVAIISLVADPLWAFALVLPKAVAPALAKKFAGFDIPYDSRDMADAVGELANVVAGDIVARLDRRGVKARMSLPMVASGTDVRLLQPGDVEVKRHSFKLPDGVFWVEVVVAKPGTTPFRMPGT
jgi:CheY-specific phosphatase CheX